MDEFHAVLLLKCYDPSNFEERALRPSPYESRIVETAFFRTRIRLDRALNHRGLKKPLCWSAGSLQKARPICVKKYH